MFYIVLIATSFFLHFGDRTPVAKYIYFFFSFFIFLIMSLRGTGTGLADYDAYIRIYSSIIDWHDVLNPVSHVEIGFRIVAFIGNSMNLGGQYIIVVMAVLSFFPIAVMIKKYSPYKMLSILVWFPYILSMNMQTSRLSVAVGFGVLFFIFYYRKLKLPSLLSFLLAVSFHTTLFLLLFAFITRLKVSTLAIVYYVLLIASLFFNFSALPANFLSLLGFDLLSVKLFSYINSEHYGYPMKIYDPRIIISFVMITLILLVKNKVTYQFHNYIFKIFIIGGVLLVAFMDVTILAWRLSYIFLVIGVVVVPVVARYLVVYLPTSEKVFYLALPVMYMGLGFIIAFVAQPFVFFGEL